MYRKIATLCALALVPLALGGCTLAGGTNLAQVANAAQLSNVTTGDGTFENYTATGHYTATDVGLAFGFPGIKLMEVFPMRSNEALLGRAAQRAAADGAQAMINVEPAAETYWGIPFIFFGIYIDKAEGTGIRAQ